MAKLKMKKTPLAQKTPVKATAQPPAQPNYSKVVGPAPPATRPAPVNLNIRKKKPVPNLGLGDPTW